MITLKNEQIAAAALIHEQIEGWRESDKALLFLKENKKGFELDSCLLKISAINTLYSTNLYATVRMARHICNTLQDEENKFWVSKVSSSTTDAEQNRAENLVKRIAYLPERDVTFAAWPPKRQFFSFAAKFCHFFISDKLFPIYDDAARCAINLHLADDEKDRIPVMERKQLQVDRMLNFRLYQAFCKDFRTLCRGSKIKTIRAKDVDRYLWIRGIYERYKSKKNSKPVNDELKKFFDTRSDELKQLLANEVDG